MGNEEGKADRDYFVLAILFMIAVAFWVSFFRYFINLDYNILLTIECDPEVSSCVTDGEYFYDRFLVKAKTIEDYCGEKQDEECILKLYEQNRAEKIPCEEDLEDWEECTSP
ncbi:MAG TPA: hypothetical protein P5328_02290 [Candidatus Paceibacterota bacterium]|nr:hypothetical protein [Candidatus Paceibacterota bacterium]HRZ34418.1 hypothetical protein [Candidatus Paceibacterota bacterium]